MPTLHRRISAIKNSDVDYLPPTRYPVRDREINERPFELAAQAMDAAVDIEHQILADR
jgi:hypothetical protein